MSRARKNRTGFTPIGLDIGDRTISAVQFARSAGTLRLHAAMSRRVETSGDASSNTAPLLSALKELVASEVFVGRQVISAIPRTEVDIRPVVLPEGITGEDDARFPAALKGEARACLLYKPEEAVIDYLPLHDEQDAAAQGTGEQGTGEGRYKVLLVAARKEVLNRYIALMGEAGLECAHLDIAPCAAARVLKAEGPPPGDAPAGARPYAVIDIDHDCTVVSIARGTELLFSRTIKFGSATFVRALAEALNVEVAEAECMLSTFGIARPDSFQLDLERVEETGRVDPDVIAATLFEICGKAMRFLAAEVKRSMDYFTIHRYGASRMRGHIERAFLLGAFLPANLDHSLSSRLSIPVSLGSAFAVSSDEGPGDGAPTMPNGNAYVVAAGLALRSEAT